MKPLRPLLLTVLLTALAAPLAAQRPLGPPFPVNLPVPSVSQENRGVAMSAVGDFVVLWWRRQEEDFEVKFSLLARRFEADGTPATGEILVNDTEVPGPNNAQVVILEDDSFVVVFSKVSGTLVARRYDPDGTLLKESTVVDHAFFRNFALAPRPDGGFVLTWMGSNAGPVWLRIFDADFNVIGPTRRIGPGVSPAVAVGPAEEMAVAWYQSRPSATEPHLFEVFLVSRRLDPDGVRVGGRTLIQKPLLVGPSTDNVAAPGVAKDGAGHYLILWRKPTDDQDAGGIYAQRFAPDGTNLSGRLRLEGEEAFNPQLAMDRAGNFVVVWGVGAGIFAQRFTSGGPPFRPAFQVDPAGFSERLASDAAGNFVVVWDAANAVFARLYRKR